MKSKKALQSVNFIGYGFTFYQFLWFTFDAVNFIANFANIPAYSL